MKRCNYITFLIALTLIGLVGALATGDEMNDKPKPKLVQAKKVKAQAVNSRRTFGSLLQKGQSVTLQRIREAPDSYRFQVRIVTEEQKKQVEDLVAVIRKESEDHRSKQAALVKQMREAPDREKQTELKKEYEELRERHKPRQLPTDLQSAKFYTVGDVGGDYVGFERNGVETFHRLSSIHRIVRGVEIDEE